MCDLLSDVHGHICDECFEELVSLGVKTDVKVFMGTDKKPRQNKGATRNYFEQIFSDGC